MANETLTDVFSDIADAIRAKGVTGQMKPTEMSTKVAAIPSGSGTRYGVSGESVLGPVDANGELQAPNTPFSFSSSDIVSITASSKIGSKFSSNQFITSVNLPNLTTISGTNALISMFSGCSSLSSVNLPNLTTISGTNGAKMAFQNCTSLTSINLSSLTTLGNAALQSAFEGCTSLLSADVSGLSAANNDNGMSSIFKGCTSLEYVDMSNLASVAYYTSSMFENCSSLKTVKLTKFSNSSANGLNKCFQGCVALEEVDFSQATAVPDITSSTFSNTNSTFKVVVPDALYETWIAKSNWSSIASQIVKASEYVPAS